VAVRIATVNALHGIFLNSRPDNPVFATTYILRRRLLNLIFIVHSNSFILGIIWNIMDILVSIANIYSDVATPSIGSINVTIIWLCLLLVTISAISFFYLSPSASSPKNTAHRSMYLCTQLNYCNGFAHRNTSSEWRGQCIDLLIIDIGVGGNPNVGAMGYKLRSAMDWVGDYALKCEKVDVAKRSEAGMSRMRLGRRQNGMAAHAEMQRNGLWRLWLCDIYSIIWTEDEDSRSELRRDDIISL
jgi:hypothetical protein